MNESIYYMFSLLGFNLVVAIGVFFYSRRQGSGRPTAVMISGVVFSFLLTMGLFVFSSEIIGRAKGVGYNKIFVPIISGGVCLVGSFLLTMITHFLLNKNAPSHVGIKQEVLIDIESMKERRKAISHVQDWRGFAANISNALD